MKRPIAADRENEVFEAAKKLKDELIARAEYEEAATLRDIMLLAKWAIEREAELRDALIWCGGSDDFAEGGKARRGWMEMVAPLITPPKESP